MQLVTALGTDQDGDWLVASLAAQGVQTDYTLRVAEKCTGSYVAVHDDLGRMVAAVVDMEVFSELTVDALRLRLVHRGSRDLVFADGNLSEACLSLLAADIGSALVLDAVSYTKAKRLRGAVGSEALFFMNRGEAESLLECGAPSATYAAELLSAQGVRRAVITDGTRPLVALIDGAISSYPIAPTVMVDETGAGDALIAGCLAGMMAGLPLHQAIPIGIEAGRRAVQVAGALTHLPPMERFSVKC